MAGIGICPACEEGDHEHHERIFTDLSSLGNLQGVELLGKPLIGNRVCDCRVCS